MSAAAETTTDANDIARRSDKESVLAKEPQFVMGVVGDTTGLHDRVRTELRRKGLDWPDLAEGIQRSRQAILVSIQRRHVQYSRVREIATFLEIDPRELMDREWDIAANNAQL